MNHLNSRRFTLPFGFDIEHIPLWEKMVQKADQAGIFPDDFESCMDYHDAVEVYYSTLPKKQVIHDSNDEEHEMPIPQTLPCPSYHKPSAKPKTFLKAFFAFIWSMIGFFVRPTGATDFRHFLSIEIGELLALEVPNMDNLALRGHEFRRVLDAIEDAHTKHVVDVVIATVCGTVCVSGILVALFLYL